jgi:hypothetical protein
LCIINHLIRISLLTDHSYMMQTATLPVHGSNCNITSTRCKLQHYQYTVQNATFPVHGANCNITSTRCKLQHTSTWCKLQHYQYMQTATLPVHGANCNITSTDILWHSDTSQSTYALQGAWPHTCLTSFWFTQLDLRSSDICSFSDSR